MKKLVALLLAMLMVLSASVSVLADEINYEVTEPVTITFWMTLSEESKVATMQKIIDDFEASQDLIKVNMVYEGAYADINTALVAANIASTDVPAIVWTSNTYLTSYANNGVIEDLTPYIEHYNSDVADFVPAFLESATIDGKIYGFPMGLAGTVAFYNKEVLEAANITFPTKWDEMDNYLETIYNATGKPALAICCWGDAYLFPLFYNVGCEPIMKDENGKEYAGINDRAYEVFTQMLDWTKKGYVIWHTKAGDLRTAFTSGDVASVMYYSSGVYSALQDVAEFTVKCAPVIEMDDGKAEGMVSGALCTIPANQPQNTKNAAYVFMDYFTGAAHNADFALGTSWLPVRVSTTKNEEQISVFLDALPALDVALDNITHFVVATQSDVSATALSTMRSYIMQIMNGEIGMEEGWEIMIEEMSDIINDR